MTMFRRISRYFILGVITIAVGAFAASTLLLPAPLPENSPADVFSAGRAEKHIAEISREIHPVGSSGTEQVVSYIVKTLGTFGIDGQIQTGTGEGQNFGLQNVVARIPGKEPGNAVLIITHFDSTPFGPGAGDNASGTAVLLEVARLQKNTPQLDNDVILLFEDGEEWGYLGGYLFAKEHPWMKDVKLVIGLDTAAWGPVILLQSTPENGFLIDGYARGVNNPTAYGFFADANWNIAHDDSEIQPFVEKGIPGIEFEDPTASITKHSALDTPDLVNPGSVQQMGSQVSDLVRQYGIMDLSQTTGTDLSFFTIPGFKAVTYPAWLNQVLAIVSVLVFVLLTIIGVKNKKLDGRKFALSILFIFILVAISAALSFLASGIFSTVFPKTNPRIDNYLPAAGLPCFIGYMVLIMTVFAFCHVWMARKTGHQQMTASIRLIWVLMALVFAFILKVGSYGFIWPVVISLAAWGLQLFLPEEQSRVPYCALTILALMAGIIFFAPDLCLAFLGTGFGLTGLPLVSVITLLLEELFMIASE